MLEISTSKRERLSLAMMSIPSIGEAVSHPLSLEVMSVSQVACLGINDSIEIPIV